MGRFDDIAQKMKGKPKQAQGELNIQRGKGIKGGMQKLKGKLDEAAADVSINARKNANRISY